MSLLTFTQHGQAKNLCSVRFHWDHAHTSQHTAGRRACDLKADLNEESTELQHTCLFALIHPPFHRSSFQYTHMLSTHTPSPSSYLTLIRVSQLKQKSSHRSSPLRSTDFRVIWPAYCLSEQSREECHLLLRPIKTLQTRRASCVFSSVVFVWPCYLQVGKVSFNGDKIWRVFGFRLAGHLF